MEKQNELVSIIIPTYNRYELLNHCIKSVLNNTYKNIEIIVVNDCSTDARYYNGELEKYEKTKIIHLPINQKQKYNVKAAQGITRNYGLEMASGEWVAFLDDDDFYDTQKLETQIKYMKDYGILFSSTNMNIITHNSISIEKLDYNIIRKYFSEGCVPKILTKNIIEMNNFINNSSVLMHKSIINKIGKFNVIDKEDWDYWKRALEYTNCLYIDIPLLNYTVNNEKYYMYIN
jgi:teichuronic acid biosynthesis glycosyltransferase TuaG